VSLAFFKRNEFSTSYCFYYTAFCYTQHLEPDPQKISLNFGKRILLFNRSVVTCGIIRSASDHQMVRVLSVEVMTMVPPVFASSCPCCMVAKDSSFVPGLVFFPSGATKNVAAVTRLAVTGRDRSRKQFTETAEIRWSHFINECTGYQTTLFTRRCDSNVTLPIYIPLASSLFSITLTALPSFHSPIIRPIPL
jgi:hypothetical protein